MTQRDPRHEPLIDGSELHDSTLDLVAAAESGSVDDVVRQLLRSLVGGGLTAGASVWTRRAAGARWARFRTLGNSGAWDVAPEAQGIGAPSRARLVTLLAEDAVLVAHRDEVDLDGAREEREDAIECLALLASSLIEPLGGSYGPGGAQGWDDPSDGPRPRPALPGAG